MISNRIIIALILSFILPTVRARAQQTPVTRSRITDVEPSQPDLVISNRQTSDTNQVQVSPPDLLTNIMARDEATTSTLLPEPTPPQASVHEVPLTPDEIATIPSATPISRDGLTTEPPSLSGGGKWTAPPSQTLEEVFARRVRAPVRVTARPDAKSKASAKSAKSESTPGKKPASTKPTPRARPTPPKFERI